MASDNIVIRRIESQKRTLMPLLLIGDESEEMIGRYLDRSELYCGFVDGEPVSVCAVTVEGPMLLEVKNLAVRADMRKRGIGRMMLAYVESLYPGYKVILGTGETPSTLRFYNSCGYKYSHRIPDFFTKNYPSPIIEEGVVLRDMLYLEKQL